MSSNTSNNEQQELLEKALFSYVGYYHAQNLNQKIDINRNEIKKMEIPKSLDKWFYEYNDTLNRKNRKNRYRNIFRKLTNKAAIIFLVLAISITVMTISVDAFRVGVFNFIIESTEKYLGIKVEEKDSTTGGNNLKGYYSPDYITEGFELNKVEQYGQTTVITYINKDDQKILFNQAPNGTNFQIDSEDSIKKDINIKGMKAIALIREDSTILFWNNDVSSFYISSDIELEELIKIAESLIKNK